MIESLFIDLLNQVRSSEKKSNAGRPAFDVLLMFKILILKTVYNLSDDQVELPSATVFLFVLFEVLTFRTRFPIPKRFGCSGNS
ncbi:MAG: transposase [Planctomycetaceae bacterium]|nr:transposase [Planctomycetaceae bacterium]